MISDDSKLLTVRGDPGAERTVAALATAMIEAERAITAAAPERVLVADDSDLALAAALAATKLDLPVAATAAARATTTNGLLIARLASDPSA